MTNKYYRSQASITPTKVQMDLEDSQCITFKFYDEHTVLHCVYVHLDDVNYELMSGLIKGEKYDLINVKQLRGEENANAD